MKLYTTAEASKLLGLSYSSLCRLRREGSGPRWVKLTPKGTIRYTDKALNDYIEEREVQDEDLDSISSAS